VRRLRGSSRLGHGLTPIPTPPYTHILPALVLLLKPLSGLAKRQLPRTLDEVIFIFFN